MTVKCKNMTHAMKAQRLLTKIGISCSVEKNNNDPSANGCVYSVKFDDAFYERAMHEMKMGGIVLHKSESNGYRGGSV